MHKYIRTKRALRALSVLQPVFFLSFFIPSLHFSIFLLFSPFSVYLCVFRSLLFSLLSLARFVPVAIARSCFFPISGIRRLLLLLSFPRRSPRAPVSSFLSLPTYLFRSTRVRTVRERRRVLINETDGAAWIP